ncbi:Linearmycin resistance ATP-binding protein LnrL [subsurface metagenome]|nr:MAG: export ABC transporter ATP-binding protein [Hadesarchaea archaeon B3_Hades]
MAIVEAHDLTKVFNGRKAVDSLDLEIEEGEFFGLLGPNGAGKSTTVAMLSTILRPTRGTVTIAGYDIKRQAKEIRRLIGVVPQEFGLYDELTAAENLAYFGKLHGVEGGKLKVRIEELLRLVQLQDRANDLVKTFSGGMKHRLNLVVGLIHEPKLLFLDEPTTGLDPQARLAVWELIKRFQSEGVTILLTTHYMEEADYLCERVAIMDRGKVIALDSPARLKRSIGKLEVIEVKARKVTKKVLNELRKLKGVRKAARTTEGLRVLTPAANEVMARVVTLASFAGVQIDSLNVAQPTLEDVFIKLTGKTLRD